MSSISFGCGGVMVDGKERNGVTSVVAISFFSGPGLGHEVHGDVQSGIPWL
jgi:hypothetical protein